MTTLPRSWGEKASLRRSPSAKEPLQKGQSLATHYLHSYAAQSFDSGEDLHVLRDKIMSFGDPRAYSHTVDVVVHLWITFLFAATDEEGKKQLPLVETIISM